MSGLIELVPAYGRDYKSRVDVLAAYHAGKDFIIASVGNRWCGKPVNKEQIVESGYAPVKIRYSALRKVLIVPAGDKAVDVNISSS